MAYRDQWLRLSRPVLKLLADKRRFCSLSYTLIVHDFITYGNLRVSETLGPEILTLIKAPPKPDYPIVNVNELALYDAFIFGIPTRYGNMPAQWKVQHHTHRGHLLHWIDWFFLQSFWDATGSLWFNGTLIGKYAGLFISSGSLGGGQESTAMSTMSTIAHHGMVYVPLGYGTSMSILTNLEEVRGGTISSCLEVLRNTWLFNFLFFLIIGSPWGAGTFAGTDGSRMPSKLELELAQNQGKHFYGVVSKAFKV